MACSTVYPSFRSTNSTVMILPAESSGYWSKWLISRLVSGVVWAKRRFTTFAGISSIKSAASSANRLSMMVAASRSVKDVMIVCSTSIGKKENTSAAMDFGSIRKTLISSVPGSSNSSSMAAISASFISKTSLRIFAYCLCSMYSLIFSISNIANLLICSFYEWIR